MKNPRRSPEQTRAAQKQREELQRIKDEEMSRKMQEAYKRVQGQSVSGMNKGGMTDAQKAASSQRIASRLGREYQGYKPGGDPRAAQRAVMATANRPAPTPMGGAAMPISGMGGVGGTKQMIKKGGMTKGTGRDGCAIRGKTRA